MRRASLPRLGGIFLRVGNLTFGGGDPTMAALYAELVTTRGWLAAETYGLVYALARITPGTNVLAFCAGTAWEIAGWPGALMAVAAVTLPAAVLAVLLTLGFEAWKSNHLAMAAIAGVIAAAVGMVAAGAWQLLAPHLARERALRACIIAIGAFVASFSLGLSPVQVLAGAALLGAFWQAPNK
ncbi:MAG TPA: chromate transporter [Bryobacteraceae bacterium]|nr:chromate transporter [Bryobacteraceae bacterium]